MVNLMWNTYHGSKIVMIACGFRISTQSVLYFIIRKSSGLFLSEWNTTYTTNKTCSGDRNNGIHQSSLLHIKTNNHLKPGRKLGLGNYTANQYVLTSSKTIVSHPF